MLLLVLEEFDDGSNASSARHLLEDESQAQTRYLNGSSQ